MIVVDRIIPYESGQEIEIGFCGDIHRESINCCIDKLRSDLKSLHNDGGYLFGMGDYFESIIPTDPRFQNDRMHPDYRMLPTDISLTTGVQEIGDLFRPFGDRMLGCLMGNHEDELCKRHNRNLLFELCNYIKPLPTSELWKRHPLDLGYLAAVRVKFVRGKKNKPSHSSTMVFWLWHGSGSSVDKEAAMRKMKKKCDRFDANLYVAGHWHYLGFDNYTSSLYIPQTGKLQIKADHRYLGLSGCYYLSQMIDVDGYADRKAYPPSDIGMLRIAVDPESKVMRRIH